MIEMINFFPGYKVVKDADQIIGDIGAEGAIKLISLAPQLEFQKIEYPRSGKSLSDNSDRDDCKNLAGYVSFAELYNNQSQIGEKNKNFLLAFPGIVLQKDQTENKYIPYLRWVNEWRINYWPIENSWSGDIRIVCHKFGPPKGSLSDAGEVRVIIFEEYIDIKTKIIDTSLAIEAKTKFVKIGENIYAKAKGHSWKDDHKDSDYHTWSWQMKEGIDKKQLIFVLTKQRKK